MVTFETIPLWKRTLAARFEPDQFQQERERLRNAFVSFRERASMLAAEIARDLPDYTVHDITHLDALWQLADLIAGSEYEITPAEAFVLGGAFLTHDLGNGLAAYPDGVAAMYASTAWRDALSLVLRRQIGHPPTTVEIQGASQTVKKEATAQVLRALHAQQAERLALVSWKDPDSGVQRFLLEDIFLRETYGRLIGRIAHSHWWDIERLRPEFDLLIGAPTNYPSTWIVDPLKLACLLRVADAAHLDARRAPAFLKTIRRPSASSRSHWCFQERLHQPILNGDRIVYTSARPFAQSEVPAWWLCFDALQILDKELTGVDSIFADCNRPRFAVSGVQGAEDAFRLSKWIQTESWAPVDTRIKVSDVAELASRLGGAQLYGRDTLVPLRELIQNAGDAIRARRFLENRAINHGCIFVRLGSDTEGHWIEVADNGIGMSRRVMIGSLLDFGASFWNSQKMMEELPGLASSRFDATGKYGIGFFSAFMWGNHVRVTSRGYREAQRETHVLEFAAGLRSRPLLRPAHPEEFLIDGGTIVRIWVGEPPESPTGVLFREYRRRKKLEDVCDWLCPAIDTNLYVQRSDSEPKLVVGAGDWKTLPGEQLLRRLTEDHEYSAWMEREQEELIPLVASNMTLIKSRDGEVVGRLAVVPESGGYIGFGAVTAGGLRTCGMRRLGGILQGTTVTASRSCAIPTIEPSKLKEWASNQTKLLIQLALDKQALALAADTISRCDGSIADLPIAESAEGWLNSDDVRAWGCTRTEVILADSPTLYGLRNDFAAIELSPNLLVCQGEAGTFLANADPEYIHWPEAVAPSEARLEGRSNRARVAQLLAQSWSVGLKEVLAVSDIGSYGKYFYAKIGTIAGNPITRNVSILRNPTALRIRRKSAGRRRVKYRK